MAAAKAFERTLKRGERFTFEYVLLGGVNDSDQHALDLARLLNKYGLERVKINLIAHNSGRLGKTLRAGRKDAEGEKVRVTWRVVDSATGREWRDLVEGSASDLFAVQDRVATEVAAALDLEESRALAVRVDPPTSQHEYLQALGLLRRYDQPGALDEAISILASSPHVAAGSDGVHLPFDTAVGSDLPPFVLNRTTQATRQGARLSINFLLIKGGGDPSFGSDRYGYEPESAAFVPFVKALVPVVDLAEKKVVIADRPGLVAPFAEDAEDESPGEGRGQDGGGNDAAGSGRIASIISRSLIHSPLGRNYGIAVEGDPPGPDTSRYRTRSPSSWSKAGSRSSTTRRRAPPSSPMPRRSCGSM